MVMRITISALFLTLSASAAIANGGGNSQGQNIQNDINKIITVIDNRIDNQCGGNSFRSCARGGPVAAPEIDPAQAVSALMLLAGSVAVLRGRRKAK
jgi:hypothetical protein